MMQLMDGEEFKALEAALAFLDDCNDGDVFFSNNGSDDSGLAIQDARVHHLDVTPTMKTRRTSKDVNSAPQQNDDAVEIERIKAKLAIPGRNCSRDLQKLELLQLRVDAATLQEQVDELRSSNETNPVDVVNSSVSTEIPSKSSCLIRRKDDILFDAWRGLAKKQKRLRRDAESENEELRALHASQIKTIKALKRLFQRQTDAKRSACVSRNFFAAAFYETERDAGTVLEQLSSSLGKVFGETDRVFRLNGLNAITSPFSKTNTQPVSPTNFRAVAKSFYSKMTSGCGLDDVENAHMSGARNQSVVAHVFTVDIEERVKIQYRYAGIRYSEHKREVIVLAGRNQLMEAFGIALDGIEFHEKSWCVMSEVTPGLCLLQLCIGLTVEVKNVVSGRQQFVNRLCEMLAHLKREVFDSVQSDVEHDLLV